LNNAIGVFNLDSHIHLCVGGKIGKKKERGGKRDHCNADVSTLIDIVANITALRS